MTPYSRARKMGWTAIFCAVIFRLFAAGVPAGAAQWLIQAYTSQKTQTGRDVRSDFRYMDFFESPPPSLPPVEEAMEPAAFSEADLDSVEVFYACNVRPDLARLIARPTELTLAGEEPTVLILHTHTTESYTKTGEIYEETADYRTLDEEYNMLSIGSRVAEILEKAGVSVLHDRTLHDYPSYTSAYTHARKSAQAILKEHPGIQLVLDLHRDALESKGKQLRTAVSLGDADCAQLMVVLGAGNASLPNPRWQENLSLALKLTAQLERQCPGITRPIALRGQRFNQDLTPTLLVEVGTAGNTHTEALLAAEELANALLALVGK